MRRIKFWFRYITKLIKRYWYSILISLAVSIGVFFLANNLTGLIDKYVPKTKRIGIVGKYRLNNLPPRISHLISYGLTEILPNNRATSSPIVSSWSINAKGKEYLFFLKDGIKWQDGTALKASQIEYSIEGANFIPEKGKLTVKLNSAFAPLPTLLNQPLFKNRKIGLGQYKIKTLRIQTGALSSILLINQNNKKDRLQIKFYPKQSSLITAFKMGEIDQAWGVFNLTSIENWKNIQIKTEKTATQNYAAIFFNTRKAFLDNKGLRQALSYCLQKPPEKDRAIGPIAPSSWAYNQTVKQYEYDPNHGKELFQKTLNQKEKLELKLSTLPELLSWAEKTKKNWETNLGIKVKIQVTNFVPGPNNFDVFLGYGVIPPDPDQYFFWHSTQPENLTGINNPKIDQLLEKGRKTVDFEERRKIYYDFQQVLSEEAPAIFLFYPKNYTVSRK